MRHRLLTVNDVAQRTGRDPRTVRRHCARGIIRAQRVGSSWAITPAEADRYARTYRPYDTLRRGRRHVDQ